MTTAKNSNITNPSSNSFAVVGGGFNVLEGKMNDPIYEMWFGHTPAWKSLKQEEQDEDFDKAVDELIKERVLEEFDDD